MAEPLLTLERVTAGYGSAQVLHDVSLEVPENGSLALLGRNGVGKSTLLLTIMGYTQLRGGRSELARPATSRACRRTPAPPAASAGWRRSARSFPR